MHPSAKILIVDDEPLNVDILEQELEDLRYQTVSATNGQDALVKAVAEAPDLILLDVTVGIGILARASAFVGNWRNKCIE